MKFQCISLVLVSLLVCGTASGSGSCTNDQYGVRMLRRCDQGEVQASTGIARWFLCVGTSQKVNDVAACIDSAIQQLDYFESETIQNEQRKSAVLGMLSGAAVGAFVYAKNLFSEVNHRNEVIAAIGTCFLAGVTVYEASKYVLRNQWIPSARRTLLVQESKYLVQRTGELEKYQTMSGLRTALGRVYDPKNPVAKRTYNDVWLPRHDA